MVQDRAQPVSVRLTAAEIAAIDGVARRHGVNRSEFMRQVLIGATSEPDPVASEAAQLPETLQNETELAADKRATEILAEEVAAAIEPSLVRVAKWLYTGLAGGTVNLSWGSLATIGCIMFVIQVSVDFGPELLVKLMPELIRTFRHIPR